MISEDERKVIETGRKVKELMELPLFREVIIEGYMDPSIALQFYGEKEQIDHLKAITHLNDWLKQQIDSAIIIKQN